MPAVSEQQRRYLNMRFGHKWTKKHHFDNKGKLPKHAKRKQGAPSTQEEMVRRFQQRKTRGRPKR
jgi:hypothetical protein